jgi:hypothetical protein
MADTAAHLVDRVLPGVPIRQWVLTLPYPLRYRCAYDAKLTSGVLRAFIRALFAELRRRARRQWGIRAEQCGAVTFIQRFGSALDLDVHFHTLALDGVYTHEVGRGQPTRFLPLPPPEADEVARVLAGAARRIQRLVEARAGVGRRRKLTPRRSGEEVASPHPTSIRTRPTSPSAAIPSSHAPVIRSCTTATP